MRPKTRFGSASILILFSIRSNVFQEKNPFVRENVENKACYVMTTRYEGQNTVQLPEICTRSSQACGRYRPYERGRMLLYTKS